MSQYVTVRLYGGELDGREIEIQTHVKEIHGRPDMFGRCEVYRPGKFPDWWEFKGEYADFSGHVALQK